MKGGGEKKQTTTPDRDLMRYREEVFNKARDVSNDPYTQYFGQRVASPDQASGEAMGGIRQLPGVFANMRANFGMGGPNVADPNLNPYANAGAVGANALSGDRAAIDQMMNPYQSQVVDSMRGEYDRLRDQATMGSNADATRGGAFGGSRHALMQGARLGAVDRAEGESIANLLYGGYNDMMGRASSAANLGLGAGDLMSRHGLGEGDLASRHAMGMGGLGLDAGRAQMDAIGRQFGMGDYFRGINQQRLDTNYGDHLERRDWGQRQLGTMMGPLTGSPYGQTTSEPLRRNAFAGAAGGAITGAQLGSVIPGIGTAIGAGIGGLGGLLFG